MMVSPYNQGTPVREDPNRPRPSPFVANPNQQSTMPASPMRGSKQKRNPQRSTVELDQKTLSQNPQYDPFDMTKSYLHHDEAKKPKELPNEKIVYMNETDPQSAKKAPKSFERFVVKKEAPIPIIQAEEYSVLDAVKDTKNVMVEKAIIQQETYQDVAPIVPLKKERFNSSVEVKEVNVNDPSLFFSNPVISKFDIPTSIMFVDCR